jgi:tetratricopeptide (TPR) repeat protein
MLNLPHLRDTSATSGELLASGNYAYAFHKATEPETRACARIMCGSIKTGLAELLACKDLSKTSLLIQAYGYWCLAETTWSLKILKGMRGQIPRKLAAFVENGAEVLVYSPSNAEKIESFENIKLSYQSIEPENFKANITKIDKNRDLVISDGVYGVNLPKNIFNLNCPTAFWVGDHDFFYATRHNDLSRATILVTNSAGEHSELSQRYKARIASFPGHELYGDSDQFPEPIANKRFDIGFTGRAFVPYMPDKAQFLYQFITLNDPKLSIRIYDGYLPQDEFMEVMKNTRFVPLFWRYAGGIQTRAIDAMRQGACVLSPEKLTTGALLGGRESGFLSVHSKNSEYAALNHLTNYRLQIECHSNNSFFRDLFWSKPSREQRFIKFCLFQSILADHSKDRVDNNLAVSAELRGYPVEQAIRLYSGVAQYNMTVNKKTVAHYNFAAGAAFFAAIAGNGNEKLGKYSIEIYAKGQEKFPNNLILKFNAARVLWTFGAKPEATFLFGKLARSCDNLEFNPEDGVLSHRIRHLSEMFSYGDYFQAALNDSSRARSIIQSCALTYLGVYAFETNQVNVAADFLKKAIVIFSGNVAAYKWLTQVLDCLSENAREILKAFYQAINLYPPNLCDLLPIGFKAELAVGSMEKASALLNNWVLYHLRVREPSGNILPLNRMSLEIVNNNQFLLKDWISSEFEQIKKEAVD